MTKYETFGGFLAAVLIAATAWFTFGPVAALIFSVTNASLGVVKPDDRGAVLCAAVAALYLAGHTQLALWYAVVVTLGTVVVFLVRK